MICGDRSCSQAQMQHLSLCVLNMEANRLVAIGLHLWSQKTGTPCKPSICHYFWHEPWAQQRFLRQGPRQREANRSETKTFPDFSHRPAYPRITCARSAPRGHWQHRIDNHLSAAPRKLHQSQEGPTCFPIFPTADGLQPTLSTTVR